MQIIVLGMHRSGTSMVTRLVNLMGAWFAESNQSLGYAPDNPKGFWERRDALAINDALLELNGCAWNRVDAWPFERPVPLPRPLKERIKQVVMDLDAHRPWVLKDPRMCLTYPYWHPLLEAPVAVVAHRDPLEVARSLQLRENMPPEYALALWEHHTVGLLNAVRGLPRVHVRSADFLADPVAATQRLFMGLERQGVRGLRLPSEREITAFVDPRLHRSKKEAVEKNLSLNQHQRALEQCLLGEAQLHADAEVSPQSLRALAGG